ncbi:MAG: S-layer homology domain-containing protein [Ruminococcaceae bacterium]|nr:S-layer homology domain-containing protein [Oscillospiraceae bacterium]
MKNISIKRTLLVFLAMLFSILTLSFAVSAEIRVEDGNVVGLNTSLSYQYASVTMVNHDSPTYTSVDTGSSSITGLTPGLYNIKETSSGTVTTVWIKGSDEDLSSITTVSSGKVLFSTSKSYVAGKWSGGFGNYVYNSVYSAQHLTSNNGHISSTIAENVAKGTADNSSIISTYEGVVFKYAYASDEIIPVEDLKYATFSTGIRQGSIRLTFNNGTVPRSIYVLHTINSKGEHEYHTYKPETFFPPNISTSAVVIGRMTHRLDIAKAFPKAEGYVVAIDVYPYGDLPAVEDVNVNSYTTNKGKYTMTALFVEYEPWGYVTSYNDGNLSLGSQYNGANTAYVQGYGDGTFKPEGDITKAEVAQIIANIMMKGEEIPKGTISNFTDISVNDWFYDAVQLLEKNGIFSYINTNKLNAKSAITRGELAQIIANAGGFTGSSEGFSDVDETHTYYSAICALYTNGIINGYEDNTFKPDSTITRAEVVTIINRALNLVVDETTVIPSTVLNNFSDVKDNHWAIDHILMASNDNVPTVRYIASQKGSKLVDEDDAISFETEQAKITISKDDGKIISVVNKETGENVSQKTTYPWFTYIKTGETMTSAPVSVDLVNGRLHVVYGTGDEAYFIIDVFDNYFTVELDTTFNQSHTAIAFGNLAVSTPFSYDANSYRLSCVAMNTYTDTNYYPGGVSRTTIGFARNDVPEHMGAKIGVTFSKYKDGTTETHRTFLKEITSKIDISVGITSLKGGAFAYDNKETFEDYGIWLGSYDLSESNVSNLANYAKEFSVDNIFIHKGAETFYNGDFNFIGAAREGETFVTAGDYKERIIDKLSEQGITASIHTYSSLIVPESTNILSTGDYVRDIAYNPTTYTVASDITADATAIPTSEDGTGLSIPSNVLPTGSTYGNSKYLLIDKEIVLVSAKDTTGFTVSRGQCGTTATTHKAGAEIRQLRGFYGSFVPIPGSDLFYQMARNIAAAYNEGGFTGIYLDAFETTTRTHYTTDENNYYYLAEFVREVLENCNTAPVFSFSSSAVELWAGKTRGGQLDYGNNHYKLIRSITLSNIENHTNYMLGTDAGWFHFAPDLKQTYRNRFLQTLFSDDIDYIGTLAIAYNSAMSVNPFDNGHLSYPQMKANLKYYSVYSRLRKSNYFSDKVREQLKNGEYEYKLFKQGDTWAFKEMKYVKNLVLNIDAYGTANANNPFSAQTPYIRIEGRRLAYATRTPTTLIDFKQVPEGETTAVPVQVTEGTYTFTSTNLDSSLLILTVTGNNSEDGAIALTLTSGGEKINYFVPLNFEGTKDIMLFESDNPNAYGYSFPNVSNTRRMTSSASSATSLTIHLTGDCEGALIDSFKYKSTSNASMSNPSITIGNSTITFNTTLTSQDYIEYFPEINKAYKTDANSGTTHPTMTDIDFEGSVTVPSGDFTYTYGVSSGGSYPARAKVVLGLAGGVLENEDTWETPDVTIDGNVTPVDIALEYYGN